MKKLIFTTSLLILSSQSTFAQKIFNNEAQSLYNEIKEQAPWVIAIIFIIGFIGSLVYVFSGNNNGGWKAVIGYTLAFVGLVSLLGGVAAYITGINI